MSYTPDQLLKITANYENVAVKQAKISEELDEMYDDWLMKVKKSLERKGLSIMDFDEDQLRQAFDRWAQKEGHRLRLQDQGEEYYGLEYDPHPVSIEKEYPAGESAYEMMRPEKYPVSGGPKKSKHEQEAERRHKARNPEFPADDHVAEAEAAFGDLLLALAKKEKKKLDPKAKVRNRGTVCVPAESAKDKKDHFPINDEDQARNALARVHQYSSAPSWYKGSLKGLQDLVSRKVHSKYPSIGKSDKKKKSSLEADLMSFAEEVRDSFLAEGQAQQPGAAQAQSDPQVRAAQTILAGNPTYKAMLGPTGVDGLIGHQGSHTRRALQAWKAEKAKTDQRYAAQMTDEQIVAAVIASAQEAQQPQQPAFNLKALEDQLGAYKYHLGQYREASKDGGIKAQNAPTVRDNVDDMVQWSTATQAAVANRQQQQNVSDEEKTRLTQLDTGSKTLLSDAQVWRKYLDTMFPRSTTATASKVVKLLQKYAQLPADPNWSGSTLDKPAAPAGQTGQPGQPGQAAAPAGQPSAPAGQAGQAAQPAAPTQQTQQPQQRAGTMLSKEQIEKWVPWLEKESTRLQHMIEGGGGFLGIGGYGGIKDFKDKDNFPGAKLEEFRDAFQDETDSINTAKNNGLEAGLDNEHRHMLTETLSRLRILIKHIDREIKRRERDEDREDQDTDRPQQQRGQPMGLVRTPHGFRSGYRPLYGG